MSGLSIEVDDLFGREAKKKREQEAAVLAQNLLQHGAEPSAVNQIVKHYAETGETKLPDYETKALPFDPNVPEGRSTRQPFQLDRKRKGLFGFDSATGKFTEAQTPEGMTDFEVRSYNVGKTPKQGYTIYVNSQTGEEIRREPNNNGKDVTVRITPPSSGGGKDPDLELAKDTLKKYQASTQKGEKVPDEFMDSVRSAADKVGVDFEELQKDPGILDSLQNFTSNVTGGAVPKAKPSFGGSSLRFHPKAGKPLTKDLATQFLQQAKGDKDKARALAKQAGYTF